MIRVAHLAKTAFAALALALPLQACASTPAPDSAVLTGASHGPALWKVADEDTTIYLFGTVHALPPILDWYDGEIADALAMSDELVTELPRVEVEDPTAQQRIGLLAVLPPRQSMRDLLKPRERAIYEAALTKLQLPLDSFDRFEPWFAAMTLASQSLIQGGYDASSGVETVIEQRAGEAKTRGALETLDGQIAMFDTLPQKSQIAFLVSTARNIDAIVPQMDAMVAEWIEGDADALARLMNKGMTDRTLADRMLYARNRQWAEWIDRRLDQPGTVFLAVGAGHLAGRKSVQDALDDRGIETVRVQ